MLGLPNAEKLQEQITESVKNELLPQITQELTNQVIPAIGEMLRTNLTAVLDGLSITVTVDVRKK